MFIYRLIIVCSLFFSLASIAQDSYKEVVLETFPENKKITLGSLSEKPTYLKFWATWCQACMEQMPHFQEMAEEYGDKVNFIAMNININENVEYIDKVINKFGLTMPVWLDNEGELGVALGLIGTPYSVLLSASGEVLYTTHNSDQELGKRLAMLADGKVPSLHSVDIPNPDSAQKLLQPWLKGEHYILFTATWCDWYLADSRPAMAQHCKAVQNDFIDLYSRLEKKPWSGVVNHLWTDDKAVSEFEKLYKMPIQFKIDTLGVLFNHFNIREIPTLLVIKDGEVEAKITDFVNMDKVVNRIK